MVVVAVKRSLDCRKAVRQVDHSYGAVDLPGEPYRGDAACSGGSQVRPYRTGPAEGLHWRKAAPDLAAVDMSEKVRVAAGVDSRVYPRGTDRLLLRIVAQGNHAASMQC